MRAFRLALFCYANSYYHQAMKSNHEKEEKAVEGLIEAITGERTRMGIGSNELVMAMIACSPDAWGIIRGHAEAIAKATRLESMTRASDYDPSQNDGGYEDPSIDFLGEKIYLLVTPGMSSQIGN